jgi:hypothetical protein
MGRKGELKMFTLAGLKDIKEVIKTVIYTGSDLENYVTTKHHGLSCNI